MKSIILYSTKHGATKQCAEQLAKHLEFETTCLNVKEAASLDLNPFDLIILGSSVYAGSVQSEMKAFCKNNQAILPQKKLGIFLCSMFGDEKADQIQMNFGDLSSTAIVKGYFGGELIFKKLSFFESFLTKVIAKTTTDMNTISQENISKFANEINAVLCK